VSSLSSVTMATAAEAELGDVTSIWSVNDDKSTTEEVRLGIVIELSSSHNILLEISKYDTDDESTSSLWEVTRLSFSSSDVDDTEDKSLSISDISVFDSVPRH